MSMNIAYLTAALAIACLPVQAQTAAAPSTDNPPLRAEVFGVPNSDQVLWGELVLPNGHKVRFGSRDGTMVTIKDTQRGYWFGFQTALEKESKEPLVKVWQIQGSTARQIGFELPLTLGATEELDTESAFGFQFRLDKISLGRFPQVKLVDPRRTKPRELLSLYGSAGGGICCVTCGSTTTCGTVVIAECGSCSAGFSSVQPR